MTTINEAREAVYERWRVQWAAGSFSAVPYAFENENFSADPTAERVRVSVRHSPEVFATLGGPGLRRHTRHATAVIQVYAPPDEGMRTLDLLAQAARAVFESSSFSGLRFFPASIREGADDGALKQIVIAAPFDYQETK